MKLKLNKQLFWDTNLRDIDEKKHADFIIGRVLQYGDVPDFRAIKTHYGIPKIKCSASKVVFLDKKSANLWALLFDLPDIKRNVWKR